MDAKALCAGTLCRCASPAPFSLSGATKRFNKPLLTDPNAPPPPRIISAEEKSRPPVYSPELAALLTSAASRRTKPLRPAFLRWPPTLPPHADPKSEMARLLGPLSKRREVNIRWRYFTEEWKKVLPPLQLLVAQKTQAHELISVSSSKDAVVRAGARGFGFQGMGVYEDLVKIAGPLQVPPDLTRKQRRAAGIDTPRQKSSTILQTHFQSHLPRRWLRRRHQELLGRLPILTYSQRNVSKEGKEDVTGTFEVALEPNALTYSERPSIKRLPTATEVDTKWIQRAEGKERRIGSDDPK